MESYIESIGGGWFQLELMDKRVMLTLILIQLKCYGRPESWTN